MKTIIKIVLALAVLTAAVQAGLSAVANYQFQDAVHEALIFSPNASNQDIKDTVVELATKQGLPVGLEDVTVRQVGPDLIVDITYETEVRLLPGFYARNIRYNPSTSTRLMPGMRGTPVR